MWLYWENIPYLNDSKTILISDDPLKIKHLLRKNILLLVSYTKYTDHVTFFVPLPISVTVSFFTVSAFTFLVLTPNISILLTARAGSWNLVLFYNIRWWTKSQTRKLCQLISVMLCGLFWISWPLKKGPIGCSEMSVKNYHSMLHNIPKERRSHITIWRCRAWFD